LFWLMVVVFALLLMPMPMRITLAGDEGDSPASTLAPAGVPER